MIGWWLDVFYASSILLECIALRIMEVSVHLPFFLLTPSILFLCSAQMRLILFAAVSLLSSDKLIPYAQNTEESNL
jgi:hypothetical protein